MNTSDFRSLHAQYDPDNAEPEREPSQRLRRHAAPHWQRCGCGRPALAGAASTAWAVPSAGGCGLCVGGAARGGGADAGCRADSAERRARGVPGGSGDGGVEDGVCGVDCAGG